MFACINRTSYVNTEEKICKKKRTKNQTIKSVEERKTTQNIFWVIYSVCRTIYYIRYAFDPVLLYTKKSIVVRRGSLSLFIFLLVLAQTYALLLVEEEDRRSKEAELGGRAEQLELMCRKNAYLQDKV